MSQHNTFTKDTNNSNTDNELKDTNIDTKNKDINTDSDDIDDYIIFEELEPYIEENVSSYNVNEKDDSFYSDITKKKNIFHNIHKKKSSYHDINDDEFIDDALLEDFDEFNIIFSEEDINDTTSANRNFKSLLIQQFLGLLKIFIIALFISVIILRFVIVNAQVPTGSMKNTILIGDRLIGFRLSYLFDDPKRGDVIIFKYPDNEEENFVKRVIGEPGDIVRIEKGIVYINDVALDEPYIREPMNENTQTLEFHVPDNCYFVMGDNRNESWDSRYWSTSNYVEKSKIIAKVLFKYFNDEEKKFTWDTM